MTAKRIVFLGTHGQYNIGDELLLETFLSQLGAGNRYAVNSYDPPFTLAQLHPRFQAEVFHTVHERRRLLHYLRASDVLFFGGGSIIKELYASVGRNRYATLLMVLLIVTFTRRLARKPIVMSNIGVGPLQSAMGKRLALWTLAQVDLLSVRDRKSYETCVGLGLPREKVQLVPDAVFANPPAAFAPTAADPKTGDLLPLPDAETAEDRPRLRVALSLNYDIENPANWPTFLQNLEEGLRSLHASQPLEIHTLPMQSGFKLENDWKVLAEFCERLPGIVVHQHRPETYRQVAAIVAGCDLVIAERLHALVVAAILGRPFLALMYDVKVRELIAGLDMTAYALDINAPFDPLVFKGVAESALRESAVVQAHLLERSTALRQALALYFAELRRHLSLEP